MSTALTISRPTVVALSAPACVNCRQMTKRFITRASNRNGNAGRPYYNKRQVAGRDTKVPGGIHYVCSQGTCDFYKPHLNKEGEQLAVVDAELLRLFISLKLV
ncbi:hypothetical protein GGTG_04488 [Gaeumannomyces tritici R3-111a-1]|uniref:GRF-like zinc ribbon domain-containing protein n=1 Tax=Gaeumannomyces tritici (strain R3-111a-1) TaxID=644352 RepID=J3NT89_GAET3|nr:hypothetical protein GGTG_04488 [Gaeumannomyces tritici R3-111a-1]EJT79404.1 hypothetical protein GGTG_04488 [Gaeumannomyces tritici R3-111a-1]